jgi:hypothetical protein
MNALLRRALARLDDRDSPVRARLMARLAVGLTPPINRDNTEEILDLARAGRAGKNGGHAPMP